MKLRDIKLEIVDHLKSGCQCDLTTEHISDALFLCREPAVIFRARLHGTLATNIHQLKNLLDAWIRSGTITVTAIVYSTSNFCAINGSSIEDVCSTSETVSTTETSELNPSLIAVIVGGSMGALVIVTLFCCVIICVIACFKLKRSDHNPR